VVGTAGFLAPEVYAGRRITSACDVFSWGCTMVFAATGKAPFGEGPPEAISYRVMYTEPDTRDLPPSLGSLVAASLDKQPQQRPTVTELLFALTHTASTLLGLSGGAGAADAIVAAGWTANPPGARGLIPPTRVRNAPPRSGQRVRVILSISLVLAAAAITIAAILLAHKDKPPLRTLPPPSSGPSIRPSPTVLSRPTTPPPLSATPSPSASVAATPTAAVAAMECGLIRDDRTGGSALDVSVATGSVNCTDAYSIVNTYFNDPTLIPQGSGGYATIGSWDCHTVPLGARTTNGPVAVCSDVSGGTIAISQPS
jgi:eukaryotic-like serine/threonine-protein kinase